MAGYGSRIRETAGQKEVAALLDETLVEEKNADKTLTSASKQVNTQANNEG